MRVSARLTTTGLALIALLIGTWQLVGNAIEDKSVKKSEWTPKSLRIMQSLSLDALQPPSPDPTNAYWNDPSAIAFGKTLFKDRRLSANGLISCSTCHQANLSFTDGHKTATGIAVTKRNTPSLLGAGYLRRFNWDGSEDSLWAQATGPIESPAEMGFSRGQLVNLIASDATLRQRYERTFGPLNTTLISGFSNAACGPIAKNESAQQCWKNSANEARVMATRILVNVAKSLGAFQTTLVPVESRFDQFVVALTDNRISESRKILNASEQRGLKLFTNTERTDCLNCHNGPLFSNRAFHDTGTNLGEDPSLELGKMLGDLLFLESEFRCDSRFSDALPEQCFELRFFDRTHAATERGAFKVPSLRNVGQTAPYMHDGSLDNLSAVLNHYNFPPQPDAHELRELGLSKHELDDIEAFLKTLTSK